MQAILLLTLLTGLFLQLAQAATYRDNQTHQEYQEDITDDDDDTPVSRQKRFVYYTFDRRLTLPRSSAIALAVTVGLPALRNLPDGYSSSMTISFPLAIDLDALYWTADENPYGLYPDKTPVEKRDINEFGSTEFLLKIIQQLFEYLGYPGKDCVHRAICELREGPLHRSYGWVKLAFEWLLTPSLHDDDVDSLADYLEAEHHGRQFNCTRYVQKCGVSVFSDATSSPHEKYSKNTNHVEEEQSHSRTKRLIFMTNDRKFRLPPGTSLTFSYTFNTPLLQFPPIGYSGPEFQFSVPLGINFDDLELTSEDNPYGTWPDLSGIELPTLNDLSGLPRPNFNDLQDFANLLPGVGRTDDVGAKIQKRSTRRWKYGTLSYLYGIIASLAERMGYPGKACLMRAICEMREGPLASSYGWVKRALEWLLTPSESLSDHGPDTMEEYLDAETFGHRLQCSQFDHCSFSLFGSGHEEYKKASHRRKLDLDSYRNEVLDHKNTNNKYDKYYEKKSRMDDASHSMRRDRPEYVSFDETIKIHNMVETAILAAKKGYLMYTDIL